MKKIKIFLNKFIQDNIFIKDKKASSEGINSMIFTLLIFAITVAGIVLASALHTINNLNLFADELVSKVALEGRCTGADIDARYKLLCESTGLKPTVAYKADYYDASTKKVQYGDAITVECSMPLKIIGFGDYYLTANVKLKATGQSMQYWKG
ncbi:MAG: DUF4320 family protein [Oscillospiraceae bacterium]